MTNIDLNTGLPEVPDGYYWEIRHPHRSGMWSIGYFFDTTQIMIQLSQPKTTETVVQTVPGPWYWPFKKEIQKEIVVCPDPGPYKLLGSNPTHESVIEAAESVLAEFNERRRMLSYIGKYPPKKLDTRD